MIWNIKPFDALSLNELYCILQLRQEVFALEQRCVYNDLDDKDQQSAHLMAWERETLIAYTRLIPRGVSYAGAASIGRVVIRQDARGKGLGWELMRHSIVAVRELYDDGPIKIGAQHHLERFYNRQGFEQTSEQYMDAGIPHIEMTLGFMPESP